MKSTNAYQIGAELRTHVLRHQRQGPVDARRLQALVADFCGGEQHELIAPLHHLVSSSTFAIAAGTDPPLGDQQNLQILSQELAQVRIDGRDAFIDSLGRWSLPAQLIDDNLISTTQPNWHLTGVKYFLKAGVEEKAVGEAFFRPTLRVTKKNSQSRTNHDLRIASKRT